VSWFEKDNNSNYADASTLEVDPAVVVNERFKAWSWSYSVFFLISRQGAGTHPGEPGRVEGNNPKMLFNELLRYATLGGRL
jgi:hypothetical protein